MRTIRRMCGVRIGRVGVSGYVIVCPLGWHRLAFSFFLGSNLFVNDNGVIGKRTFSCDQTI